MPRSCSSAQTMAEKCHSKWGAWECLFQLFSNHGDYLQVPHNRARCLWFPSLNHLSSSKGPQRSQPRTNSWICCRKPSSGFHLQKNRYFWYSTNISTSIQDSDVVRQLSAFLLLKSSHKAPHSQLQASYTQWQSFPLDNLSYQSYQLQCKIPCQMEHTIRSL